MSDVAEKRAMLKELRKKFGKDVQVRNWGNLKMGDIDKMVGYRVGVLRNNQEKYREK